MGDPAGEDPADEDGDISALSSFVGKYRGNCGYDEDGGEDIAMGL